MITITAIDYGHGHPMRTTIDALCDAADYLENRADCDHDGDEFRPNPEMILQCGIEEALRDLGESSDMLNECRR